jgi:amino acid transporter
MADTASAARPAAARLQPTLGLRDVVLFMVTAGTNLQWVATAAAAGPSSLTIWILAGVLFFIPLSVCVVFLAARYPDQGGLYVWSKRAFGPFAGFMTGWTYWTANLPYFPGLLYFAAGNFSYWSGRHDAAAVASPSFYIGFALIGLTAALILNVCGLRAAKWLTNLGAITRWVSVILLFGLSLAVWWQHGSATSITAGSLRPHLHLTDVIFWSAIAFAWTGVEAASFMGGEIKDARRTVPRALWLAAPMIAILYLLGTLSVLLAVPGSETSALYGVMEAMSAAANRLGVPWLVPVAALSVSITCLGSVSAWLGAVARIPFAAGIDHFLPKSFSYLHPRYGSPVVALATQAVIAGAFAYLGQAGTSVKGAYAVLVDMMVLATMLPFVPLFAAAIKLSRGTRLPGDVRVPGGRFTLVLLAVVGLLITLGAIVLACIPAADEINPRLAILKVCGMTSLLLTLGGSIYWAGSASARRRRLELL